MTSTFLHELDPSVFQPLIAELTREIVPVNYDRHQAGKGRSQAFGIIRRWSYRPHLSRNTWMRPHLWQLLLNFSQEHLPESLQWDGCTVNDSYTSAPHRDKGNQGLSYTISFGDFTGGNLCIANAGANADASHTSYDTRHRGHLFNGANNIHWTAPFQGRRFCLVFYKIVWPPKFLPRYRVACHQEIDGLLIEDQYDDSIVVVDRRGHVVRTVRQPQPREWIGRLTRRGQPSRVACIPVSVGTSGPVSHPSVSSTSL